MHPDQLLHKTITALAEAEAYATCSRALDSERWERVKEGYIQMYYKDLQPPKQTIEDKLDIIIKELQRL